MKFSVEINTVHDMAMLDTIIDLWREKFAKDYEGIEEDLDDTEDESKDCDDESEADGNDSEAEDDARRRAIDDAIDALRNALVSDDNLTVFFRDK